MKITIDREIELIQKKLDENIESSAKLKNKMRELELLKSMVEFAPENSLSHFLLKSTEIDPTMTHEFKLVFKLNGETQVIEASGDMESGFKELSRKMADVFSKAFNNELYKTMDKLWVK